MNTITIGNSFITQIEHVPEENSYQTMRVGGHGYLKVNEETDKLDWHKGDPYCFVALHAPDECIDEMMLEITEIMQKYMFKTK